MIQYVSIGKSSHPFFFGYRELFAFAQKKGIELNEMEQVVSIDFDSLLSLFVMANKKGIRKAKNIGETGFSEEQLTAESLEDAIDENSDVLTQLQKAFAASTNFISSKAAEGKGQNEETDPGKP